MLQAKARKKRKQLLHDAIAMQEAGAVAYANSTGRAAALLKQRLVAGWHEDEAKQRLGVLMQEMQQEDMSAQEAMEAKTREKHEAVKALNLSRAEESLAAVHVEACAEAKAKADQIESEARARYQALDSAAQLAMTQVAELTAQATKVDAMTKAEMNAAIQVALVLLISRSV